MNPRVILHLICTDWQRLRKPVIVLWVLFVAAALPFMLADPDGQKMVMVERLIYQGGPHHFPEVQVPEPETVWLILGLETIATLIALTAAWSLGAQNSRHFLTPVRSLERNLAVALDLLVFVVVPLWLLVFGNMTIHGFSPKPALMASTSTALNAWVLLGIVAVSAAWLSSPWIMLSGLAALVSSVVILMQFSLPLPDIFRGPWLLPMLPVGCGNLVFGLLSITLLLALKPWLGRRTNGPWKVVIVVGSIAVAGLATAHLPMRPPSIHSDPGVIADSIHPSFSNLRFSTESASNLAETETLRLDAIVETIACPRGHLVLWEPRTGQITRDGKWVADVWNPGRSWHGTSWGGNRFELGADYGNSTEVEAILAAIPNGRPRLTSYIDQEDCSIMLGTVLRYETVWSIPLDSVPAEIREGDVIWRVDLAASDTGKPRVDVSATYPDSTAFTGSRLFRSGSMTGVRPRLFFQSPTGALFLPSSERILHASGLLYSGARRDRWIFEAADQGGAGLEKTGLRVVLIQPVAVARFRTTASTRFRPRMNGYSDDYQLMHRYSVTGPVYRREWFRDRPDPRTCSAVEFGRWLQIPAEVDSPGAAPQRDLACFAPRFGGMMAKVGDIDAVAEGLRLGLPHGSRQELIQMIGSHQRPELLAGVAWKRGWLDQARLAILRRFKDGGLWLSDEVMALEEPSTYEEIITRFLRNPDRETYEKLRLLPGMDSMLGEAISKAVNSTDIAILKAKVGSFGNHAPYGPFLYAAKRGDAAALDTVIALYKASGDKFEYEPWRDIRYVILIPDLPGSGPKVLPAWFGNKTASSFRYDSLLRIWKPLP